MEENNENDLCFYFPVDSVYNISEMRQCEIRIKCGLSSAVLFIMKIMFVRPALELIVKRIFWVVKVKDAVLPQSPFHCSSVRRRGTADSAPVFFFFI